MITKKIKQTNHSTLLEEAKVIGYMEGYSDGRNDILKQLSSFDLLKKNWKKSYNNKLTDTCYTLK